MQKLRSSICGKRGKNLDDMEHMTGNIYIECKIECKNTYLQNLSKRQT